MSKVDLIKHCDRCVSRSRAVTVVRCYYGCAHRQCRCCARWTAWERSAMEAFDVQRPIPDWLAP